MSKVRYALWCTGITVSFFGTIACIQMILLDLHAPIY